MSSTATALEPAIVATATTVAPQAPAATVAATFPAVAGVDRTTAAATAPAAATPTFSVPALLTAMLRSSAKISDLFFSPGKPPMTEINGRLMPTGPRALTPN